MELLEIFSQEAENDVLIGALKALFEDFDRYDDPIDCGRIREVSAGIEALWGNGIRITCRSLLTICVILLLQETAPAWVQF